jgi:hypothetical protein
VRRRGTPELIEDIAPRPLLLLSTDLSSKAATARNRGLAHETAAVSTTCSTLGPRVEESASRGD